MQQIMYQSLLRSFAKVKTSRLKKMNVFQCMYRYFIKISCKQSRIKREHSFPLPLLLVSWFDNQSRLLLMSFIVPDKVPALDDQYCTCASRSF